MNNEARETTALHYSFVNIATCNMCQAPSAGAKIMGRRMNCSQGIRPVRKVGISTTVVKCMECGLIYSNPLPVPESMSQHYGVQPETYWNEQYFEVDEAYFKKQIERYYSIQGAAPAANTALDIGAGLGKCMLALERAGFEAFGIEPSRPFYERAIQSMGVRPARLQCASVDEAEFDDASFDFITFGAVLEHLYDPSSSILSALRWTKPGGLIHIEVPSASWLINKIANFVYRVQGLDYVANISPMHSPFHLYEFTINSFGQHAKSNNYDIAYSEFQVASTYLPKILDPLVKPIMAATDTGMQLEIWLRKKESSKLARRRTEQKGVL